MLVEYLQAIQSVVGYNPAYYMIVGAFVVGLVGKAIHAVLFS